MRAPDEACESNAAACDRPTPDVMNGPAAAAAVGGNTAPGPRTLGDTKRVVCDGESTK
jgi:hypothetical protein